MSVRSKTAEITQYFGIPQAYNAENRHIYASVCASGGCAVDNLSMAHFGDAIKAMRNRRHWTQSELAAEMGVSMSQVQKIEAKPAGTMRGTTYRALAKAFGVDVSDLDRLWRSQVVPQQKGDTSGGIPILSKVPCGSSDIDPVRMGLDNGLGVGYIPRAGAPGMDDPLAYALVIDGESMLPHYPPGSVVLCSPSAKHVPGRVYAIRFGAELDDECTMKRVFEVDDDRDKLLLMADNPDHHPRTRIVNREHIVRMDLVMKVYSDAP